MNTPQRILTLCYIALAQAACVSTPLASSQTPATTPAPVAATVPTPLARQSAPIPATLHPALFLVGDSIMNTGTGNGATGPWGYGAELIPMFDSAKIHVYNQGKGGRSSRGYIEEGAWAAVLARMLPGDWLLQFGHNDAANSQNYPDRITAPGSGDDMAPVAGPNGTQKSVHSYGWFLKQYVTDARAKGVTTIILSPVPRNQWVDGKIKRGFDGYVQWAADAAKSSGALYIDLNALVADRMDALGQPAAAKLYADTQHTIKAGAQQNAQAVVAGLRQLKVSPLTADLLP